MSKYTVFAFYPNEKIRATVMEYNVKAKALEYVKSLQNKETPYLVIDDKSKVLDIGGYEITKQEMVAIISQLKNR